MMNAPAVRSASMARVQIRAVVDHLGDDRAALHPALRGVSGNAAELGPYPDDALLVLAQGAYVIIGKTG